MYAIIRRYRTKAIDEVVKRIKMEFLETISTAPGFISYYVIDEGSGIQSSISVFDNKDSAEYSNRLAAYWVKEHAKFILDSPEYSSGEVLLYKGKEE